MNSKQYTIRSISPKLDAALRARAKKSGQSLNKVSLNALAQGVGISLNEPTYSDLDWFIGKYNIDNKALNESQEWLASLPSDIG